MSAEKVSLRTFVDPAVAQRLHELARANERSVMAELRVAITNHLAAAAERRAA